MFFSLRHNWLIILLVVFVLSFSRLVPHAPNFTPHCAVALFTGVFMADLGLSLAVILGSMVISDLVLGFDSSSFGVYFALGLIVVLGRASIFRAGERFHYGLFGAALSAVIFFLVSNFAVWLSGSLYPQTLQGLAYCFLLALPFFTNTLISTVLYYFALVSLLNTVRVFSQRRSAAAGDGLSHLPLLPREF